MKATLYDINGAKKSDIELPAIFDSSIREDIAAKYFEAQRTWQPYSSWEEAGKRHSASGTISKLRHTWKGGYGQGRSRIPRKVMWRRGIQFMWVGAETSGTRGGRKSHPPQGLLSYRKINDKEVTLALNTAFASTASVEFIKKRYSSLNDIKSAPFVIDSLPQKSKDLFAALEKIFGNNFHLILKNKVVRSGKGKARGRKYKSNSGLLIVKSSSEKDSFKGVDVKTINEIKISDLYPLGRLTLYTKKAIEEMSKEKK